MTGVAAAAEARAKVNVTLRILAREESGYHQLETLFCALELADTIAIEPGGDDVVLDVRGADLGDPRGNLIYRAATAYLAAIDSTQGAHITLDKRIPHGAGLGGGSSDAATTLRLLDALHGERLGVDRLLRLGATIGADVPFFVSGAPLALAWGRGERLLPLDAPPARDVVLVVPDTAMATAHAYGELARRRGRDQTTPSAAQHDLAAYSDWTALARMARNDFETLVADGIPGLAAARERLRVLGAAPAMLAGSGSALFGVFADADAADRATELLAAEVAPWRIVRTRTAAAPAIAGARG